VKQNKNEQELLEKVAVFGSFLAKLAIFYTFLTIVDVG
jgi:hypothetical protein